MSESTEAGPRVRQPEVGESSDYPRDDRRDVLDRDDVILLVDRFYELALADDVIGYIFTDVAHLDVEKHLPIMYRFWESLLLGARSYSGQPMQKHIDLHAMTPIRQEHFDRWLGLWRGVVNEHFAGRNATAAITAAESIARSMVIRTGGGAGMEAEGYAQAASGQQPNTA